MQTEACDKVELACCKYVDMYDKQDNNTASQTAKAMKMSKIYRAKCH